MWDKPRLHVNVDRFFTLQIAACSSREVFEKPVPLRVASIRVFNYHTVHSSVNRRQYAKKATLKTGTYGCYNTHLRIKRMYETIVLYTPKQSKIDCIFPIHRVGTNISALFRSVPSQSRIDTANGLLTGKTER